MLSIFDFASTCTKAYINEISLHIVYAVSQSFVSTKDTKLVVINMPVCLFSLRGAFHSFLQTILTVIYRDKHYSPMFSNFAAFCF